MRNGNLTPTVVSINSDGNVGFNNSAPEETIDVKGNIKISPRTGEAETGILRVTSVENSTSIGTGSVVTSGGLGVALNAFIGGDVDVGGILQTGNIAPDQNATRNIGASNNKFDHARSSGSESESELESEGPPSSHHDSEEKVAFKRKENPDGIEEMKTKLMRRLE